jgi:deoxyribose-phosphate aldolase
VLREIGRVGDEHPRQAPPMVEPPADIAAMIDHTLLKPDASAAAIERLCEEAMEFGFASVCVNPYWVAACDRILRGRVTICAVTAFPLGASVSAVKAAEAAAAIADGAREIDMVMNVGALKSRQLAAVATDIGAVTALCRERGALTKVILETALLTNEEKVIACVLAEAAGASFVKTSTGFSAGGATVTDVALLRQVVSGDVGVKASGGIRTLATLRALVRAGATRIGTSAGVQIVRELQGAPAESRRSGY